MNKKFAFWISIYSESFGLINSVEVTGCVIHMNFANNTPGSMVGVVFNRKPLEWYSI